MRSINAPIAAIVQSAVEISAQLRDQVIADFKAVQEAEAAAKKSREGAKAKRAAAAERRISLGKRLIEVRAQFAEQDARAAGFVRWCKREAAISQPTAFRMMKLAGFAFTDTNVNAIPTYVDAGIDSRPRLKSKSPIDEVYEVTGNVLNRAVDWDTERRRILIHELKNVLKQLEGMQ